VTRCDEARELIQIRLDGELDDAGARRLEDHIAVCAVCAETAAQMASVAAGLRALRQREAGDDIVEAVLERTMRAPRGAEVRAGLTPFWGRFRWQALAAGATVLAIVAALRLRTGEPPPASFSQAELARGRRDAELVLGIAARALGRTETEVRDRVLAGTVSPALKRLPIRWDHMTGKRR
jgi:anti-sigma factor RsiW